MIYPYVTFKTKGPVGSRRVVLFVKYIVAVFEQNWNGETTVHIKVNDGTHYQVDCTVSDVMNGIEAAIKEANNG